jgi:heat-inducible transcriptional repressor
MLSERQQKLLNILIERHIKTSQPVSSKSIVESGYFSLSSATIRCEMHILEKAGYLTHIHTSSGRVPTARAYRLYVDNLMSNSNFFVPESLRIKIHTAIKNAAEDPEELNKIVANIVSNLSDNIVVTSIKDSDYYYKTGLSSLFELPEFKEFERIFNIANVFDKFEEFFNQIEKEIFGDKDNDIQVFIGEENYIKNMKNESVILAKYPLPGKKVGSMTLIGPMRMDYDRNIGIAKCVTNELKNKIKNI